MTDSTCPMCAEGVASTDSVCPHCGTVLRSPAAVHPGPAPAMRSSPGGHAPRATASSPGGGSSASKKSVVVGTIGVLLVVGIGAAAYVFLGLGDAAGANPAVGSDLEASANSGTAGADQTPDTPAAAEGPGSGDQARAGDETAPAGETSEISVTPARDCNSASDCNTRGFRLYRADRYRAALSYFQAALERDPGHVLARYNAACMLALLGDPTSSVRQLRRLAAMDSSQARDRVIKARTDSDFDRIRTSPEFQAFLADTSGA